MPQWRPFSTGPKTCVDVAAKKASIDGSAMASKAAATICPSLTFAKRHRGTRFNNDKTCACFGNTTASALYRHVAAFTEKWSSGVRSRSSSGPKPSALCI
eukprot:2463027-Pyramimonas_sp.AAC.1